MSHHDSITNIEDQMARTGASHPMGAFDSKLPDVLCHQSLVDEIRVLATREGISASEFIRTALEVRVWGLEHVASLQARKLRRISGITPV